MSLSITPLTGLESKFYQSQSNFEKRTSYPFTSSPKTQEEPRAREQEHHLWISHIYRTGGRPVI